MALTGIRIYLALGGLGLLCLLELRWHFLAYRAPRVRRFCINLLLMGSNAFIMSVVLGGVIVGLYAQLSSAGWGILQYYHVTGWTHIVITIVVLDGVTYWWHRAYHQLPIMWRLHRVHHSDRDMDVTTSGRFHLLELAWSAVFRLAVIALLGPTLVAIVIFEIVFGIFNQLEHANLQWPTQLDRWCRTICVTPSMHRVHHSEVVAHTNANYGTIFSWWDRLFQTYHVVGEQHTLRMGLPEYQHGEDVSVGAVWRMPFSDPSAETAATA